MNGGMLVFHNGTNVSYANHSRNLSSMSSATGVITLRFLGQGASVTATSTDAVVLTVTGGKEEIVMEFLASVAANPQHGMQVIADDNSSYYSHADILTVDSISVDTGAGTFKNIIVGAFATNDLAVTNAQSGSLVTVPTTGAASTITLPTSPVDGFNVRFVCEAASGSHTITIAGAFEGIVTNGGLTDAISVLALDNTTNVVIASNAFEIGDWIEIVYSGSAGGYKISGCSITAGAWIAAN
tara:strand:+ start:513 stop:1235 length:723 start_codon:yes stop_codon:yes gene_type:complete